MNKKLAQQILSVLKQEYPNAQTELNYSTPFQLLVATILSAQCTDERVNKITAHLFADYPTVEDLANLPLSVLEEYVRAAGLWKNKAANISATAKQLLNEYHGEVPKSLEELLKLPGVGRKTASVVLANAFDIPAFPVDTHVQRVSNRLGLASSNNVLQTENELKSLVPKTDWKEAHHWLIYHGRRVCHARKPKCFCCQLARFCKSAKLQSDGKKDKQ